MQIFFQKYRLVYVTFLLCAILPSLAWGATVQKTLAWDHDGINTTQYQMYRSTNNGSTYTAIGVVDAPLKTFTDAAVPTNTALCYRVTAMGGGGESGPSQPVCFQVSEPPSVPVNLRLQ